MKRSATANWKGGLKAGKGTFSSASGTFSNVPYDFAQRFETGTGNFEGFAGVLAAVEYIAEVGRRFGAGFGAGFPGMTGRRLACAPRTAIGP